MRTIVVSNRLPLSIEESEGRLVTKPASGGLVTALSPLLRRFGGTWIGWPGGASPEHAELGAVLEQHRSQFGFDIVPVHLTSEERDGFYGGFSNEIIWPLFHDLQSRCNFDPDYWRIYMRVVGRFADVVAANAAPGDFIWAQDYHLMSLARTLRERGIRNPTGFFLHIPFPSPDIFAKLPWRIDTLESLLVYDMIGLQTPHDLDNFIDAVRRLLPDCRVRRPRAAIKEIHHAGHVTRVGAFPIGLDYDEFATMAASPSITERVADLRAAMPVGQIVISVDRLDYTKGIPDRLRAFQVALRRYPELLRGITLYQIVVPSREQISGYQELRGEIERLVTQVNGEFTQPGWVPIHHVFRSLDRHELIASYRVADAALVTPLKDGMNLVAKEYCACQVEGDGVLILSEFAGSAVQLGRDAILVNPYDFEAVAEAIRRAATLPFEKRRPAMQRLRAIVKRENVYRWVRSFFEGTGVSLDQAFDGRVHTVRERPIALEQRVASTGSSQR